MTGSDIGCGVQVYHDFSLACFLQARSVRGTAALGCGFVAGDAAKVRRSLGTHRRDMATLSSGFLAAFLQNAAATAIGLPVLLTGLGMSSERNRAFSAFNSAGRA
jgi:hypothetical protein